MLPSWRNICDGKARRICRFGDLTLYEYDLNSTPEELEPYCRDADFVFNLAGVNRPQDPAEFMKRQFRVRVDASRHAEKTWQYLPGDDFVVDSGGFGQSLRRVQTCRRTTVVRLCQGDRRQSIGLPFSNLFRQMVPSQL